jgi:hypothetical protein
MEQFSDYEIAQKRIEERKKKRNIFYLWLATFIISLVLSFLARSYSFNCAIPVAILTGLFTIIRGYALLYPPPEPNALIEMEMAWLFGDDWEEKTGPYDRVLAQERIQKRRRERWLVLVHLLVFVSVNLCIVVTAQSGADYGEPSVAALFVIPAIWFIFLIRHVLYAFPTNGMLERREWKAGEAIRLEIEQIQSSKLIHGEKPKPAG